MTNDQLEARIDEIKLWLDTFFPTKYSVVKGNTLNRPPFLTRPTIYVDEQARKVHFWIVDDYIEIAGGNSRWSDDLIDALEKRVEVLLLNYNSNITLIWELKDRATALENKTFYHDQRITENEEDVAAIKEREEDYAKRGYVEESICTIQRPTGGGLRQSSGTGYLRIKLPKFSGVSMISFTIDIWQYQENKSITMKIGGYASASNWSNTSVMTSSTGNIYDPMVMFYYDPSAKERYIYIGDSGQETWYYPMVRIRDFMASHSTLDVDTWKENWQIVISSSLVGKESTSHYDNAVGEVNTRGNSAISFFARTSKSNEHLDDTTKNKCATLEWVDDYVKNNSNKSNERTVINTVTIGSTSTLIGYIDGSIPVHVYIDSSTRQLRIKTMHGYQLHSVGMYAYYGTSWSSSTKTIHNSSTVSNGNAFSNYVYMGYVRNLSNTKYDRETRNVGNFTVWIDHSGHPNIAKGFRVVWQYDKADYKKLAFTFSEM